MNITAERIPDSQVRLTIEVDPARVEQSMDQAYRRVAPRTRVPGFRPGKAPRRVLERHVGREALLHEALDRLVPEVVGEAIKAQDLQMVDQPDLEISSLDPVVITATVPVRPTIDLGPYRDIRMAAEPVVVPDEEIEKSIDSLRRRYATIEPVERPIQEGDRVRLDITGEVEGRTVLKQEDVELAVRTEALGSVPGVFEKLPGLAKGETATFEATLPEDYSRSDIAGKPITYTVTVHEVKQETLPDVDDDFAKEVGEGFESAAALRERVTADIRARLETESRNKLYEQIVDAIVAGATLEYPPQLVERELTSIVHDMAHRMVGNDEKAVERLVQRFGDSLREQMRPTAVERVKRALVLSALVEREGITATPDEVDAELDSMAAGSPQSAAQIRQIFDTPTGRETLQNQLISRRTTERLFQIAAGEAPELPPAATADTAAPPTTDESAAAPAEAEAAAPSTSANDAIALAHADAEAAASEPPAEG